LFILDTFLSAQKSIQKRQWLFKNPTICPETSGGAEKTRRMQERGQAPVLLVGSNSFPLYPPTVSANRDF
jgi:hypothetical protein